MSAVIQPQHLLGVESREWNGLLRVARRSSLLPRLGASVDQAGLAEQLPPPVRDHLRAVAKLVVHHQRCVRWELGRIARALRASGVQPVLLKGAAYLVADLPMARGRLSSDVDVLVPRDSLEAVERSLRQHGWETLGSDEYDDHYYRAWMHELPPLRHCERGTVIDVHHTILPLTGRVHPDPALLLSAARTAGDGRFRILAPEDMLLHTSAHLFQDGDLSGGLRELTDVDIMLRHFGQCEAGFWERLVPRARQMQLLRPLYYALRFSTRLYGTPVPLSVMADAKKAAPAAAVRRLMDALALRVLVPEPRDGDSWQRSVSQWALYIRSHWLRMPPSLLLRHLSHKATRRYRERHKDRS